MSYWRWWVYLLFGLGLVLLLAFVPLNAALRLLCAMAILWYGLSTGVVLARENQARRAQLILRCEEALKKAGKL